MTLDYEIVRNLGIALGAGLLIGLERGWSSREAEEGLRVAGLRTHGLIGLLGGFWGLLSKSQGVILAGFGFVGLGLLVALVFQQRKSETSDSGITSAVALLLTFTLGVAAVMVDAALAAAAAVIAAFLLGFKPTLHAWVRALKRKELYATLYLLLISVVMLPILPHRGYGPWQALNPYQIWWMVVLVAALSYVGYFAIRIAGERHGPMLTGIFGGLAASTAVTLTLSRLSRQGFVIRDALAAGILAACGTMFVRVLLVASAVNPGLTGRLLAPMLVMAAITYCGAAYYWFRAREARLTGNLKLGNPFQLGMALKFGLLLAVIMVVSRVAQHLAGDVGIYALATASGIADVDAITLTLSKMSPGNLSAGVAVRGIVIAAVTNTLVKAGMSIIIGGGRLGARVAAALVIAVGAGLAAMRIFPNFAVPI